MEIKELSLKAYLAVYNITMKDFAQLIGTNRVYLGKVASGKGYAGKRLARDVEIATGGLVKLATRPTPKKIDTSQEMPDQNALVEVQIKTSPTGEKAETENNNSQT